QTLYPSKWELSGSNRAKCRYKGQPTHQGSGTNQIKIQITIPKAGLIPYPSLNPQVQTHKLLTYLKPCRLLSRKGRSCVTTNSKNQDQYYPLGPHIYCPAAYTCYSIGDLQRADIETHRTPLREVPNKGPNNYCILRDPANGLKGQVCKTKNRDYTHRGSAPTIHLSKVLNVIHKPKRRHNPFAGGNTSISPVGLPITHNHLHQVGSYSIGELYGSQESQVIPLLEAGPYGNHCRFYLSNWITTDAPNRAIRSICTWVPYTGQGSEAQQVMGTKVQCKVWDEPILSYDYTKSDPYTSKPLYAPRTMGNPISIQRYQILPLWVDQLSTQTHQTQAQEYKGLPYPYAPSPCKRTLMDLVVSDMSYYLIVPLGTVGKVSSKSNNGRRWLVWASKGGGRMSKSPPPVRYEEPTTKTRLSCEGPMEARMGPIPSPPQQSILNTPIGPIPITKTLQTPDPREQQEPIPIQQHPPSPTPKTIKILTNTSTNNQTKMLTNTLHHYQCPPIKIIQRDLKSNHKYKPLPNQEVPTIPAWPYTINHPPDQRTTSGHKPST
ncbi:hypothetical protein G9A89_000370, partial [Geosiphon pyriformis]